MTARSRYEAGSEALSKRRYAEAALHFEAAATLNPHASSWYMASIAWQEAFRPERSADSLAHAIAMGGLDDATISRANAELAKLESTIGTVDITAPPGWRMQIGGAPLTEAPARLHALPGAHTLRVAPVDRPIFERPLQLSAGVVERLALTARDADQPVASSPQVIERVVVRTETNGVQLRRTFGAAAFGLAGATTIAAVVLGVSALDAREAYRGSRTQGAFDHVRYLEGWTNAAWVTSLVFAAGGAALFFWPAPKDPKTEPAKSGSASARVTVGPLGIGAEGSF